MNKAFCNSCKKLVPTKPVERDGHIFLAKECPECGTNETYISSSAARYHSKRKLDVKHEYRECRANCQSCKHCQTIRFAFVNVTNRCNTNCPICFDNVPGLGFAFEPPMEYFEKLFKGLSEFKPSPIVCLFGGEPTVRKDLFEIIKLSRSYGLKTRVYTNGIRLADEVYCRKMVDSHAHVLISYDGSDPATYETLRGNAEYMKDKQKAIDNLVKMGIKRGKLTLVWVLSKGLNDQSIPELLEFCHSRRETIADVYLMPLCHTWDTSQWDYDPERITTEDVEELLEQAFAGYEVNFLPLGLINQLSPLNEVIERESRRPTYGAHPNCESVYYVLSDGEKYVPVEHYLKGSAVDLAAGILKLNENVAARRERWRTGFAGRLFGAVGLKSFVQKLLALGGIVRFIPRHLRLFRLLEGKGITKLPHLIMLPFAMMFRREMREALARHTRIKGQLMLAVLPLEDTHVLETDRLERCPTAQVYFDPKTEKTRFIPLCAWKLHNKKILRDIADYYHPQSELAGAGSAKQE